MSVRNRPLPRRQPRRQPPWLLAVLLPVVALVIVGVVFGVVTLLHSGGSSAAPEPTASAAPCLPAPTTVLQPLPDPTEVSVNVYNATPTKGLAAQTAKELKTRGFTIKAVGNDPKKMPISSVAELRFGPKGQARAELLQYYFPGAELINDGRRGKTSPTRLPCARSRSRRRPAARSRRAVWRPLRLQVPRRRVRRRPVPPCRTP